MDNFDPYNVFLAIAQRLKTGFVDQGHIQYTFTYLEDIKLQTPSFPVHMFRHIM